MNKQTKVESSRSIHRESAVQIYHHSIHPSTSHSPLAFITKGEDITKYKEKGIMRNKKKQTPRQERKERIKRIVTPHFINHPPLQAFSPNTVT